MLLSLSVLKAVASAESRGLAAEPPPGAAPEPVPGLGLGLTRIDDF